MDTKKFNGQRLREALQFRGKRLTELANELEISKQSLSLYANGENTPPYENVLKISMALGFPYEFFMTEDHCTVVTDKTYFRSQMSAKKLDQNSQKTKLEYVAKVYEVLLDFVQFPKLNLPEVSFESPENPLDADSDDVVAQIERVAENARMYWGLGMDPIENMQYLLESNGVIVTGFKDVDRKIDAFSQRINIDGMGPVYVIALALGEEKTQARLLFDMAHELGHILLHKWDESTEDLSKDEFSAMEKQANIFASAFLLPRQSFGRDVMPYATNIEFYKALKKKWGVSMQAMMYRARQLKIITGNQFQYMMRIMSAKGNKTREPGDVIGHLNSTVFQGAIDVLIGGNYLSTKALMGSFYDYGIFLAQQDLEDIMGLKAGTLNTNSNVDQLIKPKFDF